MLYSPIESVYLELLPTFGSQAPIIIMIVLTSFFPYLQVLTAVRALVLVVTPEPVLVDILALLVTPEPVLELAQASVVEPVLVEPRAVSEDPAVVSALKEVSEVPALVLASVEPPPVNT